MRLRSAVLASATLSLGIFPLPAGAQSPGRLIDEGVFLLTRGGAPAGSETFRIVGVGDGTGDLRATAQQISNGQRITSSLLIDSTGAPVTYQLNVFKGKTPVLHLQAQGRPGRLSALSSDAQRNESMREYVVVPGATAIVDDPLVHEFYFLPLLRRSAPIHLISPWSGGQQALAVSSGGMEDIVVGGRHTTAVRYTVGSGGNRREFWVDAKGRMLRFESQAQQLVAVRDELPD